MRDRLPSLRVAVGGVFILTVLTRLTGLAREIILAGQFGVSADLDAVYLGIALPAALTVGIGGGLSKAVVPIAAGLSRGRFAGFAELATRRTAMAFAWVSVPLALSSPLWVNLLVLRSDGAPWAILAVSAALASLAIVGGALGGLYHGLVNARGSHLPPAAELLAYNLVVIAALLLFHRHLGALSLVLGIFFAEWLQIVFLLPFASRLGRGARPVRRDSDWVMVKKLFWPSALMGVCGGLNIAVDRVFASQLSSGSVAALSYADKLLNLPVGLLGVVLAVPLFTRLSHYAARGNRRAFHASLLLGVRILLLVGAPAGVFLVAASEPLIGLLLQRGAFDETAVRLSGVALRGYVVAIPFAAMMPLLLSATLAVKRPWRGVLVLAVTTALNAFLDYLMVGMMGIFGIALATSIVSAVRAILLVYAAAPLLYESLSLWRTFGRTLVFSALLAAVLWYVAPLSASLDVALVWRRGAALAIMAGASLLLTGICWPALFAREWRSIRKLAGELRVLGQQGEGGGQGVRGRS